MGVAMGPNLVRMMAREASATERKTTAGLRHLQPVSHLEPTTLVSTYRYPIQSLAPTYPFRNQISPKYEGLQTERAAEDSPQIERKLESRSTQMLPRLLYFRLDPHAHLPPLFRCSREWCAAGPAERCVASARSHGTVLLKCTQCTGVGLVMVADAEFEVVRVRKK